MPVGCEDRLDITIVVMAFNEVQTLEKVVLNLVSVATAVGFSYEIVIVDDGSTDGTGAVVERLGESIPQVRRIHHGTNLGLGMVYRTGFEEARGDFVTFFPADGQFPASILQQFVPLMTEADMVLGYLVERDDSLVAKALSGIERLLYRVLLGPLPKFQGVFLLRRSVLAGIELKSVGRGWAVVMELIVRVSRGGYRIVSVPTEMRPRVSGKSKVNNLPTMWANLKQLVALRWYL